MRKGKILAALVIALVLIVQAFPRAEASRFPRGSITLRLSWQGQPLTGGSVTLYRVAGLGEGLEYVPEPEFEDCGAELSGSMTAQTARELARYAGEHGIEGLEQEFDASGAVRFGELEAGLYLLVQDRACGGFLPFQPFLVGIPMQIGETLVYEVDASPKAAPEPGSPPPPGLPQTGQTNWPVPVLGGAGLMLIAIGLWLTGRNRREG